ncbi:S8 family serine peptidase [Bacillus cereus]|uniref:S8 family serine peptidase n=1 Tax=Bacillus cereus TaxID=1396 RepID=UPI000B7D4E7A|nr:S8 family serine peptidase [Bacillus cereus]
MQNTLTSELPRIIYAEASVHSIGGQSIFTTSKNITSATVEKFYSDKSKIQNAVEKLKKHGFKVLNVGETSISIAASPSTFEKVFHTKIVAKELKVPEITGQTSTTILDSTNSNMLGLIDTKNSDLADVLEGIAINEKAILHTPSMGNVENTNTSGIISPNPPKKDYYYLEPPHDLIKLLLAKEAHDIGITGKGIKVVMVDSGFYRHPFFLTRQYHINSVILGPDTFEPIHDETGHGTGCAANIFSLAPEVDLTVVKMNMFMAMGAFEKAVEQNPDIITCSWGFPTPPNELTAQQTIFAVKIADAVKKGITVIFASGNGGQPFPGMHPDVISVGGVFVAKDGSMEATPFASGYKSEIYQNRQVPDICGLCGLPPIAAYIMLPVDPDEKYDRERAEIKYPLGDETSPSDGWAAFSGTSTAAPQIAGICALLKQVNKKLTPLQLRDILKETARDVIKGHSQQNNPAQPGHDVATGFGLVNASKAVEVAKSMQ